MRDNQLDLDDVRLSSIPGADTPDSAPPSRRDRLRAVSPPAEHAVPESEWDAAGRAALDAGIVLRDIALTLPATCEMRCSMLDDASSYLDVAAFHGHRLAPAAAS